MMQQRKPDDYVIATGKQISVKNFINMVAKKLKIKLSWHGKGIKEVGKDINKNVIIACDKAYYRPLEVNTLLGDSKKARSKLKWKPNTNLNQLVDEMIEKELNYLK